MSTSPLERVFPVRGPLYQMSTDSIQPLLPRPKGHYRRPIIIDGANVIFSTSETKAKKSILGLLSLMRIFAKHNFEVIVILPENFLKPHITMQGWEQLQKLAKLGVVNPVPDNANDDFMCFRVALQIGGVVISRDQFRDLARIGPPYEKLVHSYSCQTYYIEEKDANILTKDGHYIAHHSFRFDTREGLLFSRPKDKKIIPLLEMRYRQRRHWWATAKAELLSALDSAILVCYIAESTDAKFTKVPTKERRARYYKERVQYHKQRQLAAEMEIPNEPSSSSDECFFDTEDEENESRIMFRKMLKEQKRHRKQFDVTAFLRKQYPKKTDSQGRTLTPDPLHLWPSYLEQRQRKQQQRHQSESDKDAGSDTSVLSDDVSSIPKGMLRPDYKKEYKFEDFEAILKPSDGIKHERFFAIEYK